jgi:DNA polymerase-3 subunit gamma/tau
LYQALYRKWRPRTFDDVVGQEHITETLKGQLAAGRLSHAYLFTGTRGTGKTTCAKLLARAVNCEHPVGGNPCNECPSCQGIEDGSILDVLELDAASNNGVDQIRALRDEAIYTPAAVRKRVYIVDEVHMLSTPAFNALLKILEEPPSHLLFILATTELHKVPATIKSRCQQFAFKRIQPQAIADRLTYVAQQEGIALTAPAAELLARLAEGGLRDALSLLDQCSGAEGEIGEETVLDILGLTGNRRTETLLDCVAREDSAAALQELDGLYQDGKDMSALLGEISTLVRDLLICKSAGRGGVGLLAGGFEKKTLDRLTAAFTSAELVQMMTILQSAQAELYRSSSRRTDVELCLIRLCDRRLSDTIEGISARLSRLEQGFSAGMPAASAAPAHTPLPSTPEPEGDTMLPPEEGSAPPPSDTDLPPWETGPEPAPTDSPQLSVPEEKPTNHNAVSPKASAPGDWEGFLRTLKEIPPMANSFLRKRDSVNGIFADGILTLWVDSELTKGVLSRGETLAVLERAALAYTGEPYRVTLKVGEPNIPAAPVAPAAVQDDGFNDLLDLGRQFGNFTVK